jgi:hypothetical protein
LDSDFLTVVKNAWKAVNIRIGKSFITAWKSITKLVIFQSFVAKCCKMRII